jgi:antitoxin (DNA-binding transcriptional repressor) of toxin-antitoxin stability system
MRAVALTELEEKAGEYVHLAEGGETVLVIEQDRVLAELIPPRRSAVPLAAQTPLADAVQKGWIQPAAFTAGTPPRGGPVASSHDLLQALQRDRSGR